MKKHLFLALMMCIALTSFSAPWDVCKPQVINKEAWTQPFKNPAFDDPYVTNYFGWVVGSWYQPPYQLALQVNFNTGVPVKYYATFQVIGSWPGTGSSYKEFQVIINAGNNTKTQYFPLATDEEAYPNAWCEVIDYGPY